MQRASVLLVALLWSALTATVHAQAAEALIAHGVELRKQGQNAAALAEFQRAFDQSPSPRAAAQIALAQQALGEWVAAEEGLHAALAVHDDAWIERNRQPLTAALDTVQARLATLFIDCNLAGATLLLDGRTLGTAPLGRSVRVRAGTLQLEARAAGRQAVRQEVEIAARAEQHVALSFAGTADNVTAIGSSGAVDSQSAPNAPTPGAPDTPPLAPASAADSTAASAPAKPETRPFPQLAPAAPSTPAVAADSGSGLRTAAVVAFITGGLLLATGITAHVIREYHASKWNDPNFCKPPLEEHCGGYRKTADDAQKVMIIGYAGAGATLVTGLIIWLAAPSGSESPGFEISVNPRGGGASFTRAF